MKKYKFDSWGLGTQSTYMIVAEILGLIDADPPDAIIHSDTQWERKASYEIQKFYSKWFEDHGVPIVTTTAGDIRKKGAEPHIHIPFYTSDGGPLFRECSKHFKIDPGKKAMREFAGFHGTKTPHPKPGQFENRIGYSIDEWGRAKDSRVKYIKHRFPLMEHKIHRWESIEGLKKLGLPIPVRSACVGCPYRKASEWIELKEENPDEFEEACLFDDFNRKNPLADKGSTASALYLHRSLIPLRDVDLNHWAEREKNETQNEMFACVDGCWI